MALYLWRRAKGKPWIIRGTHPAVAGESIWKSTGTAEKALAEHLRSKEEQKLWRRFTHGPESVITFEEALTSYLEVKGPKENDSEYLEKLLDHFEGTVLGDIDQAAADAAAAKLVGPKAGPSTKRRAVFTPLAAVLNHAARRKWCSPPKFERPAEPPPRVRFLSWQEADRLIAVCGPRMAALLTFLLYTGCRVGEAFALDWSRDVDLTARTATFRETKNGRSRTVTLRAPVLAALANMPHRDGAVFRVWWPGEFKVGIKKGLGPPYAENAKLRIARQLKRAGISDFHPHDCRHHWATWFYAETRDLTRLKALGGWQNLDMVERYAHVIPVDATVPIRLSDDVQRAKSVHSDVRKIVG